MINSQKLLNTLRRKSLTPALKFLHFSYFKNAGIRPVAVTSIVDARPHSERAVGVPKVYYVVKPPSRKKLLLFVGYVNRQCVGNAVGNEHQCVRVGMEKPVLRQIEPNNAIQSLIIHLIVVGYYGYRITPSEHIGNDVPLHLKHFLRRE
jgi:hypothetical protein